MEDREGYVQAAWSHFEEAARLEEWGWLALFLAFWELDPPTTQGEGE